MERPHGCEGRSAERRKGIKEERRGGQGRLTGWDTVKVRCVYI